MEERRDGDALGCISGGATLGSRVNWRGEETRMKQVSEPVGAWRHCGSNGLTSGGSAGVWPPLGEPA